ncbi:VapC toxin family PIN domain ribonuclease [Micrococcus sp.]|uniref:VapC toxin family PIN domain ribonuclease n=1 Tax=Micrococcus sp. TaxID=1271 RepID=UPI002A91FFDD|nr:VapC toxin family PIN domain ribonuclease [Micrococcus sp.]MDY6054454.1 VapC toxin family PIN domain ribonuclease [Micrococcus sp.]
MDASALLTALVGAEPSAALLSGLAGDVHAASPVDLEVVEALRGLEASGALSSERAAQALEDLQGLDLVRHDLSPLLERIWALRDRFTVSAAAAAALAEGLAAPLFTCDRSLATGGHRAAVCLAAEA